MLPHGDIRKLHGGASQGRGAAQPPVSIQVFRRANGLTGHNFGNLFLAALTHVTGDFAEAVRVSSKVLAIRGSHFSIHDFQRFTWSLRSLMDKRHSGR